jgi:lipopolysaccharide transport protein LptA
MQRAQLTRLASEHDVGVLIHSAVGADRVTQSAAAICVPQQESGEKCGRPAAEPGEVSDSAEKAIVITSKTSIEYDFNKRKATATRDVYAIHKDMQLWADQAIADLDVNNQFRSIVATGHVVIKKGDTVATCGQARYNASTGVLVLDQKPVVRQDQNLLEAPVMKWDAIKKRFTTEGRSRAQVIPAGQDDPASKALRKHLSPKTK